MYWVVNIIGKHDTSAFICILDLVVNTDTVHLLFMSKATFTVMIQSHYPII